MSSPRLRSNNPCRIRAGDSVDHPGWLATTADPADDFRLVGQGLEAVCDIRSPTWANLNVDNGTASAAHQLGLGVRRHLTVQTAQSAQGIVERRIHLRDRGIRPALSELVAQNEHEKTGLLIVRR